jgi:hypothetical protein
MRARAKAAFALAFLLAGCAAPGGSTRIVEDRERKFRFQIPEGWLYFGDEIRSPSKSLLTIQIHSLEGAERKFVSGLPESLLPQLEGWTRYYYTIAGEPVRSETTIGGERAFEIRWPVKIRPNDPATQVTYWVVRRGSLLYILRAAYPPAAADKDEPAIRALLASWAFL